MNAPSLEAISAQLAASNKAVASPVSIVCLVYVTFTMVGRRLSMMESDVGIQ